MKFNLVKKLCLGKSAVNRAKMKMALKWFKDWFNHPFDENHAGCQRFEERILQERLKYIGYRFPYMF